MSGFCKKIYSSRTIISSWVRINGLIRKVIDCGREQDIQFIHLTHDNVLRKATGNHHQDNHFS